MEQSSVIIHKGGREEKYRIYVEDYVLSYLKEETGTLELSEFHFYGFQEKNDRKYVIYGAGRNKRLTVFDKYDLLEEIGCRLTQAGPVFLVREEDGTQYEVKGYEIFYQDNKEMQSYLIERKTEAIKTGPRGRTERAEYVKAVRTGSGESAKKQGVTGKKTPHNTITVQLGVILVALVAIVINSTNSYDKMQELNQSAEEVLFAIENQEAEEGEDLTASDDKQADVVVERTRDEDILKLAMLENEGQTGTEAVEQKEGETERKSPVQTDEDAGGQTEGRTEEGTAGSAKEGTEGKQEEQRKDDSGTGVDVQAENHEKTGQEGNEETAQSGFDEEEELEALSRNVTRYYEVERGDTLYTICKKIYGDTAYVQKICELNQITDPDNIRYGQKIILP